MVFSWKSLRQLVPANGTLKNVLNISRAAGVQRIYDEHLGLVDQKYSSRADYIRISSLKWKAFVGADGKMIAVKHAASLKYFLEPNLFPYNLRKGMRHYVLWSESPLEHAQVDAILDKEIGAKNIIWFVNTAQNQSIHGLWHAQVIYKN